MKTIIAGSRSITDYRLLLEAISLIDWEITEVISGRARGADRLGERWARKNHIPIRIFHPDWRKYGKSAGLHRNKEMVNEADALIALWDGQSHGTQHTIGLANNKHLPMYVYRTEQWESREIPIKSPRHPRWNLRNRPQI